MNGVSIVICCFNSADRIKDTLSFIAAQEVHDLFDWEVIVVNNASRDNTREIVQNFFHDYPAINSQIRDEPLPGLSNARKCGIENAKFDLIVFCDDDNHLDENYLISAHRIFEDDARVGIAGGWCKPKLVNYPGLWIEDFYGALAIEKQPKSNGQVNWVFGAGMILKKSIFKELKDRQIDFLLSDREGKKLTSGGDAEICLVTKFIGFDIYYSSLLQLSHCVAPNRLTKKYFFVTAHQNFYPVMYLFLLEKIVLKTNHSLVRIYSKLLFERVGRLLYFLPRCLIGRHRFYSFISVYGNLLFIGWTCLNTVRFFRTAAAIKSNLSHG
jgi:glycosyltransferase involved in cell wall biosynthesis